MKKVLMSLAISACALFAYGAPPAPNARVSKLDELTSTELIHSFDVDMSKYGDAVRKYQQKVATNLYNGPYNPSKESGVNVEFYRNKEVIIVTIPSDRLFMPNDTVVRHDANSLLNPLLQFVRRTAPDKYRVLLVMHTDNNGSERYTDALSLSRVDAVFDWFADNGADTRYIFPTASGASEPLPGNDNNSYENRARNRRLEIYLIPGKQLVESLKKQAEAKPVKKKR